MGLLLFKVKLMLKFTKYNHSPYPDALLKEAEGLEYLRKLAADNPYIKTPHIYQVDENQLEITHIRTQPASQQQMANLGKGLAFIHHQKQSSYGFKHGNYIGLNPQPNILSSDWGQFFVEYRLGFQISLIKNNQVKEHFAQILSEYQQSLIHFLNGSTAYASLIHGDLWAGNVLFDAQDIWLIDPAAYFGDREADIAMTEMFGGFSEDFYRAYNQNLPLSPQYPQKKMIYNLYHYLNHYNLFGLSYLSACQQGFSFLQSLST